MSAHEMLIHNAALVEDALEQYIAQQSSLTRVLTDAMRYGVLDGGKRVRPTLTLECCRVCGGEPKKALPFACAVEMIHSYSLIHDDLPCMDNDLMRRGKPSTHAKYGESTALLAGDALLTLAFDVLCDPINEAEVVVKAVRELSHAAGYQGMVGGQIIDLQSENKIVDAPILQAMHAGKTGALIAAAATLGVIAAKGNQAQIDACRQYALHLGLMFQITDDILDATADSSALGKTAGKDLKQHKSTYVTLYGLDKARQMAKEQTDLAIETLYPFGQKGQQLADLVQLLCNRNQ
nr:farnesyl diphosphate synthase [uncultured Solibaculum sp.]